MADVDKDPREGSDPPESSAAFPPRVPELEARRRAAAILEVLGGALTPAEAAESLGISIARYYLLEARALEGLVGACEPRPRGRAGSHGSTLESAKRENDRLRHELTRTQALTRTLQRAAGVGGFSEEQADAQPRRRRRPRARALLAARALSPPPPMPPPDPPGAASSSQGERAAAVPPAPEVEPPS